MLFKKFEKLIENFEEEEIDDILQKNFNKYDKVIATPLKTKSSADFNFSLNQDQEKELN